ncbi:AbiTii domain-containing protein [Streptomyces variabilis]
MIRRRSRLDRLERDVLDEARSLAPILRQVIALGGDAHSAALRAWALHELQGYENNDTPIPGYRRISAPLMMDFVAGMGIVRNHQVSFFDLPDFAREDIGDELRLGIGVRQIESLIASHRGETVPLGPPMAAGLATLMSQQSGRQVLRIYWSVHVSALEGVLDQIRTRLVQLVGELRAAMPRGQQDPTPDQVAEALQNINIVTGDNSSVNVMAPVAVAHRRGSARVEVGGTGQRTFPWMLVVGTALAGGFVTAVVVAARPEWF